MTTPPPCYNRNELKNEKYDITSLNRREISKLITEQNDAYLNTAFDSNFNFYPLDTFEYKNKDDLLTDIAYNPNTLFTAFAIAFDEDSYNEIS